MPVESVNRIAYIDPQGQLNTIDPTGQGWHQLTQEALTFQFPTWAPDGSHLSVIGGNGQSAAIYAIKDQSLPAPFQKLYFSQSQLPFYLYWAPDSQVISFLASHSTHGVGLHLVSLTDEPSTLLATGQPLFWDWTPEGDQILMHSGVTHPDARLALIDVRRSGVIGENIARPGLFQAPGIAPSGRYWAYAEIDDYDNGQLVVEEIATQERIDIPYEGAVALNWSPTRDQLAFITPSTSVRRYYGALHLLDPTAKSVRLAVDAVVLAFFWSPNGQYIAYLTMADVPHPSAPIETGPRLNGHHNGPFKANGRPDTSHQTDLFKPLETLSLDLWSLDVATLTSHKVATIEPSSLFMNQFLPFFDQYALSHRLWSPDSQALVLPIKKAGVSEITVAAIDGAQPVTLAPGEIAFWSWQ
ncbi:MAG: hypothetical protein KDI79_19480 [Anaerolineae bacterium]|nr:hypothetical protein [Anaerolineae bacterium]